MSEGLFLQSYLAPLEPWLKTETVTDILVNRPGEVWVETQTDGLARHEAPDLTEVVLGRLGRQIAAATHQGLSREHPLLSAALPDGSRVQIISPPASRDGFLLAIRRHAIVDLDLNRLAAGQFFDASQVGQDEDDDRFLQDLLDKGERQRFLGEAVKRRKTIVISGGTGSGKTTLLNALLKEIPASERLVLIEDAPEVRLGRDNSIGLLAVRGDQGESQVDAHDLLTAALRMRPDRILLGELRGREALAFLRAVNSGHPGSITTVHANDPKGALDQITLLTMAGEITLDWTTARAQIDRMVDIVVQVSRKNGRRGVKEIAFTPRGKV